MLYLPIADMNIGYDLLITIGFIAGILSGLYGIGGGVISTPVLIFSGVPSYIAIGASSAQTVGTAFAGTIRNIDKKTIDIKIGLLTSFTAIIGSFIGVKLFTFFRKLGYIDMVIAIVYIAVFGAISLTIYCDIFNFHHFKSSFDKILSQVFRKKDETIKITKTWTTKSKMLNQNVNVLFLLFVGFATGILSAILGIGGATILVPLLIYGSGFPIAIASATALFQTLITSAYITFLQATYNSSVDMVLFSVMLISSIFGVHIGNKLTNKFNQKILKLSFATIMVVICIKFVIITFIQVPLKLFIVE